MKPVIWEDDHIKILDQTALPFEEKYIEIKDVESLVSAIKEMRVRGAPMLGVVSAYGLALASVKALGKKDFRNEIEKAFNAILSSRPTAKNIAWALKRVMSRFEGKPHEVVKAFVDEAKRIEEENLEAELKMAREGARLIEDGMRILTHCNTGSLATSGIGTALGIIKRAKSEGKDIKVFATETRPLLQGSRLTAWELSRENIPVTVITDGSAGYLMARGEIDIVIVGADRVAKNGDTANKIGTYTLAVLAMENAIPFYVACPTSTIDLECETGEDIKIEERSPEEVLSFYGERVAPFGVGARNPAFDITPHYYIKGIITERGIIEEPYIERIPLLLGEE